MKAQSSPLPTSAEDVELSKFDEVQYIEQVEIRVRAVRASSRAWLETLKLSNQALCSLSTAMTDLTAVINPGKTQGEDNIMLETNTALVELSNRLTSLVANSLESKKQKHSMFAGMDELLKRIEHINRKGAKTMNTERERHDHYTKKVRKMRRKFILKREFYNSSNSLFPKMAKSSGGLEKKIARNEIKLSRAQRRYLKASARNSQAIQSTIASCDDFFQPCFKQMILWLVTYYRSVAGAFDELGNSILDHGGQGDKLKEAKDSPSQHTAAPHTPIAASTNPLEDGRTSAGSVSTINGMSGRSSGRSSNASSGFESNDISDIDELIEGVGTETSPKTISTESLATAVQKELSLSVGHPPANDQGADKSIVFRSKETIQTTFPLAHKNSSDKNSSDGTGSSLPPSPTSSDLAKSENAFLSVDYVPSMLDDKSESAALGVRDERGENTDIPLELNSLSTSDLGTDESEPPFGGDRPYSILGELGEGAFGTTTLVMDDRNSEVYVLKRIICESVEQANEALDEARTLSKFDRSEHIVHLHDFFLDVRLKSRVLSVCLVMEYVPGGDLADMLKSYGGGMVSEPTIVAFTHQLLTGLSVVHNHGFLHRDLKPANLLLTGKTRLKIGDFGVAAVFRDRTGPNTVVGTPHYMAPEVVNGEYGRPADVWSLGCIVYEMCTLLRPDFTMMSLPDVISEVKDRGYSQLILDVLRQTLCRNPKERSTPSEILLLFS
jgi:hypothetical protein